MRPMRLLGAFVLLALAPLAVLLGLTLLGDLAILPGLVGIGLVGTAALALAAVWARDIALLEAILHRAMADGDIAAGPAPRIPAVERTARGIERLARSLASRAGEIGVLLHANDAIIERLPDPLLVLSPNRSVQRANAAMGAAFPDQIPALLRTPALRAAIARAWSSADGAEDPVQTVALSLPVPIERELQATVIYLDPPLADGGQALVVLSDRTRERRVEQMRADFVANLSHELRTPLASVIGFIETLQGPAAEDQPAQVRFLAIMAEQAERMRRLIDDLLSLSRIELVEHQPPADKIQLAEVVRRAAAGFEPRLAERETTLTLALHDGLPLVEADADQVSQVATNLIENAIKYGRVGGHVKVSLAAANGSGNWPSGPGLVLSVEDDGPGIARAHLPRLTERFYRVDKARSRNAGGTGLGLAIVKHIVSRHRGHLFVESDEGQGCIFSIWLPVRR